MPIGLRRGVVTAVTERVDGLVRLEVDGIPCLAYPRLTGEVEVGDDVVVNIQARELGLGSGGFDVLAVNLTRGLGLAPPDGAHVMAWPFTPGQHAVRWAEEDGPELPERLNGLPVVCCALHSQLGPVCAALRGLRVVVVQLAGGALPVSLSDTLRELRGRGLVEATVAVAPCVDGDHACVGPVSGLATAGALGAEVVVCAIGPGIVGTGSRLGHGGLATVEAANAATALEATAIVAPRVSFGDPRARHLGLSHHTRAVLDLALGAPLVAWPVGLEPPDGVDVELVDAGGWEAACEGLPLSHMGRGPADDPWFFAAAYAAGALARAVRAG